ncbi:hypothetical protein RIF29_08507 [Crotalaria pallida]|uniref:Uncharacterized protein n=1 Tax=Crotalaria pallida TaxID=3830 RepID=A0AAN9ILJ3_CROPI
MRTTEQCMRRNQNDLHGLGDWRWLDDDEKEGHRRWLDGCEGGIFTRQGLNPPSPGPQTNDLAGTVTEHVYLTLEDVPEQIYLAQVPIMNSDPDRGEGSVGNSKGRH